MIAFSNSRWWWLGAFLIFSTQTSLATAPIETISPADLFPVLPKVPVEWKCSQGQGKSEFSSSGTPQTTVIRQYEVPPKPTIPPEKPLPPGVVTLLLLDLGSEPNPLTSLSDPTQPAPKDLFKLALFTGRLREPQKDQVIFSGPIGNRLLVQVIAQKIKPDAFKKILQSLDFGPLVALAKQLPSIPLTTTRGVQIINNQQNGYTVFYFNSSIVDELNPQATRTVPITFRVSDPLRN